MRKYKFLFFTLLLAFLFFPKDAFALTISNVQFLDNSNNVTATYTKSDIDNGIIGKDNPFLATKIRFNFTNSGLKNSTDYNFTSNFDLAGNRVFDTIFTSRLYSGSSQQTQSYKWMLLSTEVLEPIYNGNYSFNTNWTNNNTNQDLRIDFDLGGEIIVYSFRLNQAKLLSEGENVGDSINNQTQELLENQNKNQQQTNKKLDEVKDTINNNFNKCYKNEIEPFSFSDTSQNGISIKSNGNGTFTLNGRSSAYTAFYLTQVSLTPNIYYTLSGGYNSKGLIQVIEYDKNPATLSNGSITFYNKSSTGSLYIVVLENTTLDNVVFKPMLVKGQETFKFVSPGQEKCINKMDETNEKLGQLNSFLEDDSAPSSDISSLGNVQGLLPPGPVDSLLNIPFKFLSIIVSSLGDLCVPMSINWVFNKTLTIPCFGDVFYDNVPSYLMIFINLIPSSFILINYFKHLYKKVERATALETNSDDEWGVL